MGARAATREDLISDWLELELRHTVSAFGGGALLAAVSLVLVPEGAREFGALAATGLFAAGGVAFGWLDRALAPHGGAVDQLIAMLLDFVPEATALGAILLFSAGGILYLVFQDMAPQGRIQRHGWPAQGAVAGFAQGLAGHLLVG